MESAFESALQAEGVLDKIIGKFNKTKKPSEPPRKLTPLPADISGWAKGPEPTEPDPENGRMYGSKK